MSLVVEGTVELPRLAQPFLHPDGVPGSGKVYEHFAFQHVLMPAAGVMLLVRPDRVRHAINSRLIWALAAASALTVTAVEANTSRTDLFRPYPFDLPQTLATVQMVTVGEQRINVLQALHLLCSHILLMGAVVVVSWPQASASQDGSSQN